MNDENLLQKELNMELRDLIMHENSIVDIKFSTTAYPWGDLKHYEPSFSAMILYKKGEEK